MKKVIEIFENISLAIIKSAYAMFYIIAPSFGIIGLFLLFAHYILKIV